jgi:hypothetical protein
MEINPYTDLKRERMQEEQVTDGTENFIAATSDALVEEVKPQEEIETVEAVATDETNSTESMEATKKKSRSQRRIESLSGERNKALDRISELEAELNAKNSKVAHDDIDPADFDTYEEYEKATKHKEIETPKTTPQVNPDFKQAYTELQGKFDDEADRYPDFDDKVQNPDLRITDTMVMAFNELDNAVDTVYYFANNPKEAKEVAEMTPAKQSVYVVKKALELSKAPKKRLTKAPEPFDTVVGDGDYQKPDSELSFAEFEKKQNAKTSGKKFW